jgi:lipoprotein-anchoring transpeptidase ErfK/SrfK
MTNGNYSAGRGEPSFDDLARPAGAASPLDAHDEPGAPDRRRRTVLVGAAGAAVVVLAAVGGVALLGGGPGASRGAIVASSGVPAAGGSSASDGSGTSDTAVWPPVAADLRRAFPVTAGPLVVRTGPDTSSAVLTTLPARTRLGSARVLLAGPEKDGWVQVAVPQRPNGRDGWVPASAVRLEGVPGGVVVDLSSRRITVTLAGKTVVESRVGIGSAENPTPRGTFFVTDRVAPPNPDGAYGAFALGLSGYSPTLTEFGGGDGQVGIHGTNDASSVGAAVSHGCIRVPNDVALALRQVPLGTPVVIR